MRHSGPAAVLVLSAALASGCSTAPLERTENLELAQAAPLPHTISIELEGDELFGSYEEWLEELTRAFERLRVCSGVMNGSPDQADLHLKVVFRSAEKPSPPKIDSQGALLDFLAWSTVPLLPLWIPDVHLDPGVATDVTLAHRGRSGKLVLASEVRPPVLKTTQLERHQVLSWPMAGALFLPPFVFRSPDPERIRETLAERLRLETACRIAGVVKLAPAEDDLLRELEIKLDGGQPYLLYTPSEDLMRVRIRVEGKPALREIRHPAGTARKKVSLKELLAGEPASGSLLRIEAEGRNRGQRLGYSIRLDAEDPGQKPEV
jgi:hypothetical protein